MVKLKREYGKLGSTPIKQKVVADALTEAKAAVENYQEVNRALGRRLTAEQEVGRALADTARNAQRALRRERQGATVAWWLALGFLVAWLVTAFVRVVG